MLFHTKVPENAVLIERSTMLYEQFVQEIEMRVQMRLRDNQKVYTHTATKNNGRKRQGLTFVETGINISPTVYLEEYYERYQRGYTMEEIVKQLLELYERIRFQHSWEGNFIQKYENVRGRIIYQLINREANKELLQNVPHIPYLDLAIVFYVLIELDKEKDRMATMLIKNEHLGWWDVTVQDIYRMADENTERILPYEFSNMLAVIEHMLDDWEKREAEKEEEMYVLSNAVRNYGAAAILYPNRLKAIADYLGESFYVLPSSVHEVIIIPKSKAPSKRYLSRIVKEINGTQVKEEEVLSDCAYYYDKECGRLMI